MPGRTQRIPLSPQPVGIGTGCVGVLYALFFGLMGSATAQQPPPGVDRQQVEQAISRMMGRSPAPQPRPVPGGIEVVVGTGHAAPIVTVATSADGRYVLSSGFDDTTRLWDTAAGQEVRTVPSLSLAPALALGFSPDGARALIGYGESTELLDTASGALRARLEGGSMRPLLVTSSGRVATARLASGAVAVIDPASGAVLWSVPGGEPLEQLALSDDGTLLAVRPANATQPKARDPQLIRYGVQLWDLAERRLRTRLEVQQRTSAALSVALSPDGRLLVVEAGDGSLQVYDVTNGARVTTLVTGAAAHPSAKSTLVFSPRGTALAFASLDGVARLWRVPDYALLASPAASALVFSADGQQLVLGKAEGGAPVAYDITSGRETPIAAGASEVIDLALIAGGAAAVTASGPGGARVWDLATGQLLASLPCHDSASARSVAASPTQPLVALGCADGSVALTELAAPYASRLLRPTDPKHVATNAFLNALVRFDGEGRRLVTVVEDELAVWDVASGQALQRIALPPAPPPPAVPGLGSKARSGFPPGLAAGSSATSEVLSNLRAARCRCWNTQHREDYNGRQHRFRARSSQQPGARLRAADGTRDDHRDSSSVVHVPDASAGERLPVAVARRLPEEHELGRG